VDRTFEMFLQIPGVESVNATHVQGRVKHYNIRVELNGKDTNYLSSLWPFCNVSVTNGDVVADYIVRPEEVKAFYKKLSKALRKKAMSKENTLIFKFDRPLTEKMKQKVMNSIRSNDRVIWGDNKMAIILENSSEEVIKAVRARIEKILKYRKEAYTSVVNS